MISFSVSGVHLLSSGGVVPVLDVLCINTHSVNIAQRLLFFFFVRACFVVVFFPRGPHHPLGSLNAMSTSVRDHEPARLGASGTS